MGYCNVHKLLGYILWSIVVVIAACFGVKLGKKIQKHECGGCK